VVWFDGENSTFFYGTTTGNSDIPPDAIVRCPLPVCGAPTVLFRGQQQAALFGQDATAIYWTTAGSGASGGFTVWKAAK
jgi:hypothetical protein